MSLKILMDFHRDLMVLQGKKQMNTWHFRSLLLCESLLFQRIPHNYIDQLIEGTNVSRS